MLFSKSFIPILKNKKQEYNIIDSIKVVCKKYSKEKTGKKPITNVNLVRI